MAGSGRVHCVNLSALGNLSEAYGAAQNPRRWIQHEQRKISGVRFCIPGGRRSCLTFASSARKLRRGFHRCFADLSGLRLLPRGSHWIRSTIFWPTQMPHSISQAHCSRCMAMHGDGGRWPRCRSRPDWLATTRTSRVRSRRSSAASHRTRSLQASKPLSFRPMVSLAHYRRCGMDGLTEHHAALARARVVKAVVTRIEHAGLAPQASCISKRSTARLTTGEWRVFRSETDAARP